MSPGSVSRAPAEHDLGGKMGSLINLFLRRRVVAARGFDGWWAMKIGTFCGKTDDLRGLKMS